MINGRNPGSALFEVCFTHLFDTGGLLFAFLALDMRTWAAVSNARRVRGNRVFRGAFALQKCQCSVARLQLPCRNVRSTTWLL